jgi:hypothetical protein
MEERESGREEAYRTKKGGQGRLNREGMGKKGRRRRVAVDCHSISIHLVHSFYDPMNHHDPNFEYNI